MWGVWPSQVARWSWGEAEGSVAVRQAEWGRRTYEAGVLEAGDHLWGQGGCDVRMGGRGGGLVAERGVVAVRHAGWSWRRSGRLGSEGLLLQRIKPCRCRLVSS